ncbi:hypothetical protein N9L54_05185 [Porticoccaceae bacterium]|jgi:hypothetical protein|nr:hypothetical protein [Porticoccaceae bacterium]
MSKRSLYISGTILFLSTLLFLRALTMDVSLPGATVVNIHLLHQQGQLFNFSLLGVILSGLFFFRAWKRKGKEVLDDINVRGTQAFDDSVKKLSYGFSIKRIIVILVVGAIGIVGANFLGVWMEHNEKMRWREDCMQSPHGTTQEEIDQHEHYCVMQSLRIDEPGWWH